MKKIALIGVTALASLSLTACTSTSSEKKTEKQKSSETSKKKTTKTSEKTIPFPVVETTPEELLQKSNASSFKNGEKYKFTATLISDVTENSQGDYYILVKAGENSSLTVLVNNKDDGDTWQEGTIIEFVTEIITRKLADVKVLDPKMISSKTISGETTLEAKQKAKAEKYFADMKAQIDQINATAGMQVIDSIEQGSLPTVFNIYLNSEIGSTPTTQIKTFVSNVNSILVNASQNNGEGHPRISYYFGAMKIGENRSILNPSEVKFNKNLN